jgi:hypothetical protein
MKVNAEIERILKCRMNGKCKGCDLSRECKKFRKYIKENSQYSNTPVTHTARMMRVYTATRGGM